MDGMLSLDNTSSSITSLEVELNKAGPLGNGTILAVGSASCIRSKILSSYDIIMIFLSVSRCFLQTWIIMDLFMSLFCESSHSEENLFVIFKTVVFLHWLKQRIPSLVPGMLIAASLFSCAASLPFSWDIYNMHNFSDPLTTTSSSERRVTMKTSLFQLIPLCNAGIALTFIVFVVSSMVLIRSLWKCTRQVQNKATGFRDPSLEAHIGAIKLVFSFLILYIFYFFGSHFIQYVSTFKHWV
ncbi:PREDICTED: taste receptor type 2 member 40 [Buceros rhinoceros silvestris]|uniref:taste receptor type 2 member 40 n=1 Tax=Buceros rhinoceros silvestris TaxID=175836 RepID=UPI000528F4E6|nr:PREDICTED: taste receptor type 2 member 40 [Buceros rhinoceros silvestris]